MLNQLYDDGNVGTYVPLVYWRVPLVYRRDTYFINKNHSLL